VNSSIGGLVCPGQIIWTREVRSYTGINGYSRTSPAVQGDILIIGTAHGGIIKSYDEPNSTFVLAVNATNGNLIWKTLVESHPMGIVTTSPTIYNGSGRNLVQLRASLHCLSVPVLSIEGSLNER
jgi:outer membrane protein assembly factor BamB